MDSETKSAAPEIAATLRKAALMGIEQSGLRLHEGRELPAYCAEFEGAVITILAETEAQSKAFEDFCARFIGGFELDGTCIYAKRIGEDSDGTPLYLAQDPDADANEETVPDAVHDFLNELTPDDTGHKVIEGFSVRYEGFTDLCNADAIARTKLPRTDPRHLMSPEFAYEEAESGWRRSEGGRPIDSGMIDSDSDNPILWAVWKVRPNAS